MVFKHFNSRLQVCQSFEKLGIQFEQKIQKFRNCLDHFLIKNHINARKYASLQEELTEKQKEQELLMNCLNYVTSKLKELKIRLSKTAELKSLYESSCNERDLLSKELTDCIKIRYLYEDHAESIKREMGIKLSEKDLEIGRLTKELQKVAHICVGTEKDGNHLKQKTIRLEQVLQKKTRLNAQDKEKISKLHANMLEKHNENVYLKKRLTDLKNNEDKILKFAELEEKLLNKERENVTLREEIAMLKIELEKTGVVLP